MSKNILDSHLLSLEDILKNSIFNIPIYQRPYSWRIDEVNILLQDINGEYEKNNEGEYYIGKIIFYNI